MLQSVRVVPQEFGDRLSPTRPSIMCLKHATQMLRVLRAQPLTEYLDSTDIFAKIKSIESLIFFSLTWRYAFFFFFFTLMKLSHKILSVVKVVIKEWVLYFFSLFILFYIISFVWFLWNSLFYFSQDQCVICLVCGKTFFFFSTEDIWKMFNLLVLVERCFPKRHLEWWGFIYHSRCHLLACHSERCLEYHNEMTWLIIHTIEVACASVLMLKF